MRSALPVASLRQYAPQTGEPVGQHLAVPLRPPYSGDPSAGAAPAQPLYGAPGPDLGDAGDPLQSGDATWQAPLSDLRGRVTADLDSLGVDTQKLGDETFEARSEYAYPLMDLGYQARRNEAIKALMPIGNLIMTGRQGTFRYIFTDTAMEMGMMAADMVIDGVDRRHAIFNHRNENTVIETQSVA